MVFLPVIFTRKGEASKVALYKGRQFPVKKQKPVFRQDVRKTGFLEMEAEERLDRRSKAAYGYAVLIMTKILPLLKLQDVTSGNVSSLQSLLSYINRNYTRPLTRSEVAVAVGYNESYISHLFSDALHTTLTDYINALRMDDAFYLLSGTDLTVSRIAENLGFGSLRSFNRTFLKYAQMTPSDYRAWSRFKDKNA